MKSLLVLASLAVVGCFPAPDEPRVATPNPDIPVPAPEAPVPEPNHSYIGDYVVAMIESGKPADDSSMPPGQRFILTLSPDGKWQMANFLTGFFGTWEEKDGKVILTTTEGPTGKVDKPQTMILVPTPDRSLLVEMDGPNRMEFRYDPNARREIDDAMQRALGR